MFLGLCDTDLVSEHMFILISLKAFNPFNSGISQERFKLLNSEGLFRPDEKTSDYAVNLAFMRVRKIGIKWLFCSELTKV